MSDRLRILSVAGSDSGGGAGIQADLQVFWAHGVHGLAAVTSVTAQNTLGVLARFDVPAELVERQIEAVADDLGVDAVKIGMLGSRKTVAAVARALGGSQRRVPVVLDPVAVAGSGDVLLDEDAVGALRDELWPLATVVTPNLPEAALFAGTTAAAEELARSLAAWGSAVVLKGGHAVGEEIVDRLAVGEDLIEIRHPRLRHRKVHGTGCALSAAVAVGLARGRTVERAVRDAIRYVRHAVEASLPLGGGARVLTHPSPAGRAVGTAIATQDDDAP